MSTLALAGCAESPSSGGGTNSGSGGGSVETSANPLLEYANCLIRDATFEDCDNDGVINANDILTGIDDDADNDGDLVLNNMDRYPGFDDKTIDIDSDGTPDYLDTYFGDNFGDVDGDGWSNGIDPQPYVAPPSHVPVATPPPTVTTEYLNQSLLEVQMRRKYTEDYLNRPDRDFDGIPDDIDTRPTQFTNDRDGDGDPDFYDPEPGNAYVDSRNDIYDPRNDEYWEDD
jgi:hypothetical protein